MRPLDLRSLLCCLVLSTIVQSALAAPVILPVLPAEHQVEKDPETGATLTYLSDNPGADSNLYFHERSWTADGAAILFNSSREKGGLMAYLTATGELVPVGHALGGLSGVTASAAGCGLYGIRGRDVLRIALEISPSDDPSRQPSSVVAIERVITTLPDAEKTTTLSENSAGTLLSVGLEGGEIGSVPAIMTIDIQSGAITEVCRAANAAVSGIQHVQWSHTDPNILSYAGHKPRLMVVDIREGHPRAVYPEWVEELVTHESWWVQDQIIFCGGTHPEPTVNSHVKLLDLKTGTVRIVGGGSWWAGGSPSEIARYNWWHADGSDDGRWIVADNWHGDIMLFEGKTTRPRLLTGNHRTYGKGAHPHVGFDRAGRSVIFTSHKRGNPDVCVATIPETWQRENPS
ncbi:MAG: hypothetical protein L3K26_08120 [Candidatus Hydrogenedentes bacterium]|nr:hypothetical protein [Candidatus Hydrogenedentota bacterium]